MNERRSFTALESINLTPEEFAASISGSKLDRASIPSRALA